MASAAYLHVKRIDLGEMSNVVVWNSGGLPATEIATDLLGSRAGILVVDWVEPPEPFDVIGEFVVATIAYSDAADPDDDQCVELEVRWDGGELSRVTLWPPEEGS